MADGQVNKTSISEVEWSLSSDGIERAAINELCTFLLSSGYKVAARTPPTLPLCELRITSQNIAQLRSLLLDDERRDTPFEMSAPFRFDSRTDFLPLLSSRICSLLERTVRYKALVESIRSNKTIAFVGSGLSVDAGYPDWKSLLQILANESGLMFEEEDLAAGGQKALMIAERCKQSLPNYNQILEREYGEKRPGYTPSHIDLLRMPFASYMTTNFDPCLEVAAEHVGKCPAVQVWPAFTISRLGSGDIFYLHAKVPRRGQNCPIDLLRLTASDYREAYDESTDIAELITLAMNEENVLLFIGYGLREPAIREVLKSALIQKKARAARLGRHGVPLDAKRPHFALVPEDEIASEEVVALLNECNVQIIEFSKYSNFVELKRILTDLFYRTLEIKAPLIRGIGELLPTDEPGLSG